MNNRQVGRHGSYAEAHNFPVLSDKVTVERRKEARLRANQAVTVTALGLIGMLPMAGRTVDTSPTGLQVRVPNALPCGSTVKVEAQRIVMIGEVRRCNPDGDSHIVGLMVFHSEPSHAHAR